MKKSRKVLREKLLQRYNGEFACNKPSKTRIEKIRNYIKSVKRGRQKFVADQMPLIEEQLEQEKVVREYISDTRDCPGLAVTEATTKSFDIHRMQ